MRPEAEREKLGIGWDDQPGTKGLLMFVVVVAMSLTEQEWNGCPDRVQSEDYERYENRDPKREIKRKARLLTQ